VKVYLLLFVTAFLSSCASIQPHQAATSPDRTIASIDADGVIDISGFHSGEQGTLSYEDLALTGKILEDEFGISAQNFRVLTQTPDAHGRMHFSFKITRSDAFRIVDSRVSRLRHYNPGVVRTPAQVRKDQETANCMLANYTVSNFLAEFSAMDSFQFKFNVPQSTRIINLRTGRADNTNPRCEIWGEQSQIDDLLYSE
jgi:hypothetical protein